MPDLDAILPLRKAGIYANPLDEEALLPRVYGNFLDTNAIPAEDTNGGFTPAVCIDQINLIYLVNDGPAVTTQPKIYFNGELQENSVATWNPSHNVEGLGNVATLTFRLIAVKKGEVSVKFGGSVDGSGVPIVNPVLGLYHLLTTYAGWTLSDFDRGVCEQSSRDMTALGYPLYAVFNEAVTIRDLLLDLLPQYHTDFTENGQDQLSIILDRSLTTLPVSADYHVPAHEIEDNGSPATALQISAHADDVANQVTLHGRHNWVAGESTATYTWDYVQSQSAYNAVYPVEFTFRNMYTLAHATQWLNSFAMLHGFEPRTISFTLKGLKGIPLIPPRFITVEWPLLGWVKHLLKIKKTSISFSGRRIRLECIDCQREITDSITSPTASPATRRQQLSRTYTYVPGTVGTDGNISDPPVNTRNEAANGDCEAGDNGQWDLVNLNASKQWTFVENPSEAYQGRWYLRHNPASGNGDAVTLRQRIDPGEWLVASAWFRQHTASTNGQARVRVFFYDQDDTFTGPFLLGNPVVPTDSYLESVAFGQAPAGSYYYRAGIGFAVYPTLGQWRADHLFAASGTQQEVVAARQGALVSRNFIINGDFEAASVMWSPGPGWLITNTPTVVPSSGVWYAAHGPTAGTGEDRLNSLTKISVIPGEIFTFRAQGRTLNNPTGQARLGVTWIDGQGNALGENATVATNGPLVNWTPANGAMTVPAGAVYAHPWVGITGHSGPSQSYWLADDLLASLT